MYRVRYFLVHTNSDSAKREKDAVTFVICVGTYNMRYDRENVKFQDSGTKIKINTAKCQLFLTLPERSVGKS